MSISTFTRTHHFHDCDAKLVIPSIRLSTSNVSLFSLIGVVYHLCHAFGKRKRKRVIGCIIAVMLSLVLSDLARLPLLGGARKSRYIIIIYLGTTVYFNLPRPRWLQGSER